MTRTLTVPAPLLDQLNAWFRAGATDEVEDMAVVLGIRGAKDDVATTVLRPNIDRAPGWYEQRLDHTWHELYDFAFKHQLDFLMQIHSHPGTWTGHSRRDDLGAVSDQRGFLSLVLADFGQHGVTLDPPSSIHERTETGWRTWRSSEIAQRVNIVPSSVDLRENPHA